MFNLRYEQEYERALQELEEAKKGPLPSLEEYDAQLTDEGIVADDRWCEARKMWFSACEKYFGKGWNSTGKWVGRW